jgi:hypothetical protein
MSGTAIVREILANDQRVLSIVPATSVRAGIVPQGNEMPAVCVHTISETEEETIARNMPVKMIRELVQVTVYAKDSYALMKRLMKASSLSSSVHRGNFVGFKCISVLPWGVGPEIPPTDDKIYEQSRDFMVTFVEAN